MNYEEFKDLCNQLKISDTFHGFDNKGNETQTPIISQVWVCGNNCENTQEYQIQKVDPYPQYFTSLEILLEHVAPEIYFLQYQKIIRTLMKYDTQSDGDYYSPVYAFIKYIKLRELYDYLSVNFSLEYGE